MKRRLLLLCSLLALGAAQAEDVALSAAINSAARTPANAMRDAYRHPEDTLAFFGLKPTQTVVELIPGGGWWTEILGPYLRASGKLVEAGNDPDSANEGARRGAARFKAKLEAQPALYDRVQLGVFDVDNSKFVLGAPGSADLVLTFRNIHNWVPLGEDKTRAAFQAMFTVLKKGGVLGVEEHRLPAAREQDPKAGTGYLHEAYVIRLAESVGFKLAGRSEVNANAKDTADHPGGVWALPPTFANKDQDHDKYEAIGESDRMTLKFVKP
ncbi:MAG: class I SAM-dependent methyltransferase [Paucibacter sp.]|nr:class I SAM-dependent methyltransferase [Roseateles sp.]